VIPTAPLRVRNRLAEIILAALENPQARRELAMLGEVDAAAPDWLEGDDLACRPLVRARALSALAALGARAPGKIRALGVVLDAAATRTSTSRCTSFSSPRGARPKGTSVRRSRG
jgi:hypothetical protein